MSRRIKRTGVYGIPVVLAGAVLVALQFPTTGGADAAKQGKGVVGAGGGPGDTNTEPDETPFGSGPLLIEPVAGLTTQRHIAPAETAIPLGTVLRLAQSAHPESTVTWTGAVEVIRNDRFSIAECPLTEVGMSVIRVVIERTTPQWAMQVEHQCTLNVVDVPASAIQFGPVEVSVEPVNLDEFSTNEETMYYFFNFPSVARLRDLGGGRYRTSIARPLTLAVGEVNPPGFAPLMEWRIDGQTALLGPEIARVFPTPGVHAFSVGPPDRAEEVEIEAYGVTITSHVSGVDIIPEGEPVTFEAVTDPPGYEEDITWISSTKYGTGVPIISEGPTFTVQFDSTWGEHPVYGRFQWLGVRADNDLFNQDQKLCPLGPTPHEDCRDFQEADCVGNTAKTCWPRELEMVGGFPLLHSCNCYADDECGGIRITEAELSCAGECTDPDKACQIHIDGENTGQTTMSFTEFQDGDVVTCKCAWACPDYDPAPWNAPAQPPPPNSVQRRNNCYNYSTNRRTNTFAQPGRRGGMPITYTNGQPIACVQVINGAESDGLKYIGRNVERQNFATACDDIPASCLVALVITGGDCGVAPGCDYHWYRYDQNGKWSHKPGGTQATNRDNAGSEIDDPRTADRGIYNIFCGFFCVPCEGVIIRDFGSPEVGGPAILVAKMVFSGREDPLMVVEDPPTLEDIVLRLTGLTPTADPLWDSQLGYRGVLLDAVEVPSFPGGGEATVRIWDGVVAIGLAGNTEYFLDDTHLEDDLLNLFP